MIKILQNRIKSKEFHQNTLQIRGNSIKYKYKLKEMLYKVERRVRI